MGKKNKKKVRALQEVVIVSDPNADVDDLLSYAAAAALGDEKAIKPAGVIATGGDNLTRVRRAMFAKGAFISLGYPFLTVASGSDYPRDEAGADGFFAESPESMALVQKGTAILRNPQQLLQNILARAEEKSVTLVINAQMNDAATYLQNAGEGNLKKIDRVIVMCGMLPELSEEGTALPDPASYNVACCPQGAANLFEVAQKHNLRMILVPKEAVYQVQVGRDFYDRIDKLKSPAAKAASAGVRCFLKKLWDDVRSGQYLHFDVQRFMRVFMGDDFLATGGAISPDDDFEKIWPQIKYFNLYDVLSVVVAAEKVFQRYGRFARKCENFRVYEVEISDPDGLREELQRLIFNRLDYKIKLPEKTTSLKNDLVSEI